MRIIFVVTNDSPECEWDFDFVSIPRVGDFIRTSEKNLFKVDKVTWHLPVGYPTMEVSRQKDIQT
jgi:hypothetical protein